MVTGQAAELVLRLRVSVVMDAPGAVELGIPTKVNVGTLGALAGSTVKLVVTKVALWAALSVTFTVNEKLPGVVGLPLTRLVDELSVKPPGKAPPPREYVYGEVPPVVEHVAPG